MGDDESRSAARRAKAKRLEAALAAIEPLTPDEAEIVYYAKMEEKLEKLLALRSASETSSDAPSIHATTSTRSASAPALEAKQATQESTKTKRRRPPAKDPFVTRAEKVIAANPQGLRAYEIADAIGQSKENVRTTLKKLRARGRVVTHGSQNRALWTLPGVKPVTRMSSIDDAIVHVLSKGPMGSSALITQAIATLQRLADKTVTRSSVSERFTHLVQTKTLVHHGADDRGVVYALAGRRDDEANDNDDDDEGGDDGKLIIN